MSISITEPNLRDFSGAFLAMRSVYSSWRLRLPFLLKIAAVEQLVLDLFQRETARGGVACPRHVSPVKIAAVRRFDGS